MILHTACTFNTLTVQSEFSDTLIIIIYTVHINENRNVCSVQHDNNFCIIHVYTVDITDNKIYI